MALGRGLGEILSEVEEAYEKDFGSLDSSELEAKGARVEEIEVSLIVPNPYQPRKHFDETALQELSDSIRDHGLLQPIVVMETDDEYILIAGERRLRAHKLAELDTIKAIIADVDIDDIRLRELALIENIQRENLNAIELAHSYAELIDVHKITHEELSDIIHKSRSQITNTMRLLTLSSYVQEQIMSGNLSQGHAKVLVGIDEEKQKVLADTVVGQKLSVRETENLIKSQKTVGKTSTPTESLLKNYAEELEPLLPFKHAIKKNKIEISLTSKNEIEKFIDFIKNANN